MSAPLLVMHSPGDRTGAGPWTEAFRAARWSGEVVAFDLPGHGEAVDSVGGHLDFVDPAFMAVEKLGLRLHDDGFVALGVGESGWAATLLSLAGTTQALALVDGLGAPFLSIEERADRRRARLRLYADTSDRVDGEPDPRWSQSIGSHHRLDLMIEAIGALKVPVLLIESPASEASEAEVAQIKDAGASVTVTAVEDTSPAGIAAATTSWASGLSLESGF